MGAYTVSSSNPNYSILNRTSVPTTVNNSEIDPDGVKLVPANPIAQIPSLAAGTAYTGAQGDSVTINYSTDNSNWHSTLASDDLYIRFRIGSGSWSIGVQFRGAYVPNNYIDLSEISVPDSPSANTARIYSADDGGTTRVYYKDSGGTVTTISTSVAGSDTQVQFNDSGSLGASASLTWNGSELGVTGNVDISTGSKFQINNVDILTATTIGSSVVSSSLTSVGTIATGVWQGTAVDMQRGGLNVDVSGFSGILKISGGTASAITDGSTNWDAAYSHISANGTSHSYIDQDVTTSGTPTFSTVTVGNTGLTVGSSTPFSDASGTLTLQNVDALDATTESTIEAAIDTLSSLTTIGTVTAGTLSTGTVIAGVTMTLGSDATGDVYYRNASGVLTRLAIGSATQVLTVSGGLPTWDDGVAGAAGEDGHAIVSYDASGTVDDAGFLAVAGRAAKQYDGAVDTSTDHLWVRGASSWADNGSLQGTAGDKYKDTSSTSVDLDTLTVGGSQALTVTAGYSWTTGQLISGVYDADNYFVGTVSTYSGTTLTLDPIVKVEGSGSQSSWTVNLSGGVYDEESGIPTIYTVNLVAGSGTLSSKISGATTPTGWTLELGNAGNGLLPGSDAGDLTIIHNLGQYCVDAIVQYEDTIGVAAATIHTKLIGSNAYQSLMNDDDGNIMELSSFTTIQKIVNIYLTFI